METTRRAGMELARGCFESGAAELGFSPSLSWLLLVFSLYLDFYISDKFDSKSADFASCGDDKYHEYKP